jgi:nucleotide-binding universal stress UspA family protein
VFDTVVVGGEDDADAAALAELLAAPGARVVDAVEDGADLIVVGCSRRGLLGRLFAGDDVAATLRSAPCTVAVAPRGFAGAQHSITRIGVGYDGSPNARAALDVAKALAARDGAQLRALGVASPPQGVVTPIGVSAVAAIEANRERIERCIAEIAPGIVAHAVDGIAHQKLAELSAEVDLLVIGSSRHGTIGRVLLGSTSEVLSRETACPLLVVPGRESSRPEQAPPHQPASPPAA